MVAGCQDPTLDLFLEEHTLCRVFNHRMSFQILGDSRSVVWVNRGRILRASRIVLVLLQLCFLLSHRFKPLELIQWLIQSVLLLLLDHLLMPVLHHVGSLHSAHNDDLLVARRLEHVLWTSNFTTWVSPNYEQSITVLAVSRVLFYLLLKSSKLLARRIIFHLMVGDNCGGVLFSYVPGLRHIILIDIDQLARAVRMELLYNRLTGVVIFSTCSGWNDHVIIDLGALVLSVLSEHSNWGSNSTFLVTLRVVRWSLLAHNDWTSLDNWVVSLLCGLDRLRVSELGLSDAIEGASACLGCQSLIRIFNYLRKSSLRR